MTAKKLLEIWAESCKEAYGCEICFFNEICPFNMPRNPIKTLTVEEIKSFIERAEKKLGETRNHFRDAAKMIQDTEE